MEWTEEQYKLIVFFNQLLKDQAMLQDLERQREAREEHLEPRSIGESE